MNITEKLTREFGLRVSQVESTVRLIDEGNTIPFIARYRKEATGGLSDVTLRELAERLLYLRNLEARKEEVLRLIEEQGQLTEALANEIAAAEVLQRVEDLYKPFRRARATRASKAREKGLQPLADAFLAQDVCARTMEEAARIIRDMAEPYVRGAAGGTKEEQGAETVEEAVQGACDIIAEEIADDAENIAFARERTAELGTIVTAAADPEEKTVYETYYEYSERISTIPNHRVLAVNRGEKEKKLKVKVEPPVETILSELEKRVVTNERAAVYSLLRETVADAYKRLIAPSVEREMRNLLTERAEEEAVKLFAKNTEKLLMTPPVRGARVIAIDPGYRTGCKVAVLSETGRLLAYTTVYPTEPKCDVAGTEAMLAKLIERFHANTIVIGNGTASRETEEVVADFLRRNDYGVQYTIVNEAGASVYSASKLASEEYPDLDVTTRGAMSLGRRLQDPLSELVKISPRSIGVGQYQHDVDQAMLDTALTNVVEDCVNRVGVDLNTASPSLLSYIAGVNMTTAKNIVSYREEHGSFTERRQLLKVARLGEKTYEQCAGFLRIRGGSNPLDATGVHPESYAAAEKLLARLGVDKEEIAAGGVPDIGGRIREVYHKEEKAAVGEMAAEFGVGVPTLRDIIEEIKKPGRDPRDSAPPVVFRSDVRRFEDLKPDMEMTGTVRNVVDFGAFVDIGVKHDGLVHISQLSDRFVKHPLDVVAVGDTVRVKILSLDAETQRVGLSMRGVPQKTGERGGEKK